MVCYLSYSISLWCEAALKVSVMFNKDINSSQE